MLGVRTSAGMEARELLRYLPGQTQGQEGARKRKSRRAERA